jgi:AmmeMemoRadiSam system protein B
MAGIRSAAVAGAFYPRDAQVLRRVVWECLDSARASFAPTTTWPKAVIVPHAGYVYSGAVAAPAYLALSAGSDVIHRVVLLGPSHRVPFEGLAVPEHESFETPLGRVRIDETSRRDLLSARLVQARDDAHRWEHALEVQLPFLQEVLESFSILPIVIGHVSSERVAAVLERVWGGDETVIVVSSDLSHYHPYNDAKRIDATTAEAIERLEPARIHHDDACGRTGIQGLLTTAKHHGLSAQRLDLRSSGDTAGRRDEVVGYGAWAFTAARNGSP